MRGRKPKPVELRVLEGNPGKRNIGKRGGNLGVDEIKQACIDVHSKKVRAGNIKRAGEWVKVVRKRLEEKNRELEERRRATGKGGAVLPEGKGKHQGKAAGLEEGRKTGVKGTEQRGKTGKESIKRTGKTGETLKNQGENRAKKPLEKQKQVKKGGKAAKSGASGKSLRRRKGLIGKKVNDGVKREQAGKGERNGGVEEGTPLCPKWLNEMAKVEWRRIAPILKRLNLLSVIDRSAMASYCQAYARWRQAEEMIEKHGMYYPGNKGKVEAFPFVRIAQKYLEICKTMCVEFGMTPSSRGRMLLPSQKSEEDEFEKLLD